MPTEGDKLKREIKLSGKPVMFFADALGVSRDQIYRMYAMDLIPNRYKIALKKVNIDVNTVVETKYSNNNISDTDADLLKVKDMEIEYLNAKVKFLEDYVDRLTKQNVPPVDPIRSEQRLNKKP